MIALAPRTDDTLTLVIEIAGEDAAQALDRVDALVQATERLLPGRPAIGSELGDGNIVAFFGQETSLRLLHALAVKRGFTTDDDFDAAAGLEP